MERDDGSWEEVKRHRRRNIKEHMEGNRKGRRDRTSNQILGLSPELKRTAQTKTKSTHNSQQWLSHRTGSSGLSTREKKKEESV